MHVVWKLAQMQPASRTQPSPSTGGARWAASVLAPIQERTRRGSLSSACRLLSLDIKDARAMASALELLIN